MQMWLRVAKVGLVIRDLPFREVFPTGFHWPLMAGSGPMLAFPKADLHTI